MDIRSILGYLSKYKGTEVDAAITRVLNLDEELALKVDKTTKINGIPLETDINLTYVEVGALPADTRYGATVYFEDDILYLYDADGVILDSTVIETGAQYIGELKDVRVYNPTNRQALIYDSELQRWMNKDYNDATWGQIVGTLSDQTDLQNELNTITGDISSEASARIEKDQDLQEQIDAITAASDVSDIVGTYAELLAYDTSTLQNNNIIKVLQDETKNDQTSYYRWVITEGVGEWVYIGGEGPYYTISSANNTFVPLTRTVNNKPLSADITLTYTDVDALPDTTKYAADLEFDNDTHMLQLKDQDGNDIGSDVKIKVDVDNETISENEDGELQAIALVDQNEGGPLPIWSGTMEEYKELEALEELEDNIIYHTTDDEEVEPYLRITRSLGQIVSSTIPLKDPELQLLDGRILLEDGFYKRFVNYIGELYQEGADTLYYWRYVYDHVEHVVYTRTLNLTPETILYNADYTVYSGNDFEIYTVGGISHVVWKRSWAETYYAWSVASSDVTIPQLIYTKTIPAGSASVTIYSAPEVEAEPAMTLVYDSANDAYVILSGGSVVEAIVTRDSADDTTGSTQVTRYNAQYIEFNNIETQTLNFFTTEDNWQTTVSTKGVCGKFVYTKGEEALYHWTHTMWADGVYTDSTEPEEGDDVYLVENGKIVLSQYKITIYLGEPAVYVGSTVPPTVALLTRDSAGDIEETSTNVRLPKISGIIQGTLSNSDLGNIVDAGLPNHTHTRGSMNITGTVGVLGIDGRAHTGAFYYLDRAGSLSNSGEADYTAGFDASRSWTGNTSNPVYSDTISTTHTVQPQTVKVLYYIVAAEFTKTDIEVDIDNALEEINNKADVNLSNISTTGTIEGAGWAMPSSTYENLTLGESGISYTAPANGYYTYKGTASGHGYFYMGLADSVLNVRVDNTDGKLESFIPVQKGKQVTVTYSNVTSTVFFRFVYAVGSESEAS